MVWAIEHDSALVGVATIAALCRSCLDVALVVRPDRTRRGIGYALLQTVERWGRERGIAKLRGTILWENTAMRALARRAGFSSVDIGGLLTEVELSLR
jgi:GNAT superfamily N-acetyltransferase